MSGKAIEALTVASSVIGATAESSELSIRIDPHGFLGNLHRMVKMTVNYEGALRCNVTHGPSGAVFQTDAPVDNNGRGEATSPTDLCAASLGSCMATIIGMQTAKHDVDLSGMRIEVNKEMSADLPRRIVKLSSEIWIPIPLDDKLKRVVELAAEGCPTHRSLHPEIDKPITYHWQ